MSGTPLGASGRNVEQLIRSSLAPGTWSSYSRDWQMWVDWCVSLGFSFSVDEFPLLLYIGHCRELGWSVSRINRCIAGLAFGLRMRGIRDFTKCFLVVQALRGWRRGQVLADTRRPVSFQLLQDLGGQLVQLCNSPYEACLFRVSFSLAFFGALRIGELVSPSVSKPGGLQDEDVDLFPDRVVFCLRHSKTDQFGRGRRVELFQVPGSTMCPVLCVQEFRLLRAGIRCTSHPFLIHSNGSFLSRFQFLAVFRKGIRALGLSDSQFSGHSFRIGAATEAARLGLGEDVIKRIGRWESARFRSYVRIDGL